MSALRHSRQMQPYIPILQTLLEGASCAVLASLRMVGHVGSAWNVRVLS